MTSETSAIESNCFARATAEVVYEVEVAAVVLAVVVVAAVAVHSCGTSEALCLKIEQSTIVGRDLAQLATN